MARLLVSNIEPGISDNEIREFFQRYGFPAFDAIERISNDGPQPAVTLTFHGIAPVSLRDLQGRMHNLYWKGRTIGVQILRDAFT